MIFETFDENPFPFVIVLEIRNLFILLPSKLMLNSFLKGTLPYNKAHHTIHKETSMSGVQARPISYHALLYARDH